MLLAHASTFASSNIGNQKEFGWESTKEALGKEATCLLLVSFPAGRLMCGVLGSQPWMMSRVRDLAQETWTSGPPSPAIQFRHGHGRIT